ncbi:regulatory protein RecX [Micromonospora craniellae]|uniref:Regulatory protein RecX n=1 Tax=Micromonospora craniellae TaxID=2294034 RepID=A0A372G3W5_9ACTN|nr:regulatory protein RecX [Micromonospora craniellae]QOC92967.1 regulatory protein RecX [Micromonospora craniellae]RFS47747.1 regulatory protein RecX [Micromonospora craniellae]
MAGRRARTGRGWDASPPRTGDGTPGPRRGRRTTGDKSGSTAGLPDDETGSGTPSADATAGGRGAGPPRDEAEVAREICLRQLAARPRTRAELATALARRGISEEIADQVLDRYDEVGIIDDAAFARAWVTSRHAGRGLARRALANELRRRGVDGDTASEALGELDETTEAGTARALVERKLRTARGEPDAVFRRLVGMLARKGYPPGVAIRAVKEALAAQSAEAAEFAERLDADALIDAEGDAAGGPGD